MELFNNQNSVDISFKGLSIAESGCVSITKKSCGSLVAWRYASSNSCSLNILLTSSYTFYDIILILENL